MQEPAIVITRAYDLSLWLFQKAEHLPRAHRILLGDRLINSGLDLLLLLVRAAYLPARSPRKAELLDRAALETNTLRYLIRIAKDLRLISVDSYTFAAEKLEEIGRMTGGWRIFPGHSRLVRPNVQRFRAKLRQLQHDYEHRRIDWDDVQAAVQAWIAHASHGDTWKLRQRIFAEFPFVLPRPE